MQVLMWFGPEGMVHTFLYYQILRRVRLWQVVCPRFLEDVCSKRCVGVWVNGWQASGLQKNAHAMPETVYHCVSFITYHGYDMHGVRGTRRTRPMCLMGYGLECRGAGEKVQGSWGQST